MIAATQHRDLKPQTEHERLVVDMVLRQLESARKSNMNGELSFRLVMVDGGIRDRYIDIKIRDR